MSIRIERPIVVDVGCMAFADPETDSIHELIRAYRPSRVYGFDPNPSLDEGVVFEDDVRIERIRAAAWTEDTEGRWQYLHDGVGSRVVEDPSQIPIRCVDFSDWLRRLRDQNPAAIIIVKMDAEGSEYRVLPDMIAREADQLIDLLVVEWHGDRTTNAALSDQLACEVEPWWR